MTATFADLPTDILHLITAQLDIPSFLSLTATCRSLAIPSLALSAHFWHPAVLRTFRVPNTPLIASDGLHWKRLYQRLRTQTRPYTWGSNSKAQLGHSWMTGPELPGLPPTERMRAARRSRQSSWPEVMAEPARGGIIADLQAGGWSTTYLTSKGVLYLAGVLDGHDGMRFHQMKRRPERLRYPRGWTDPEERYDGETALEAFSAGRSHILGLSDRGRIWSWWNAEEEGVQIKLLGRDLHMRGKCLVKKVIAGWGYSAALIEGIGIVLWDPVKRHEQGQEHEDTMLVIENKTVPQTAFERSTATSKRAGAPIPDEDIGEVQEVIVLEHCVIFNTHRGRAFGSWLEDGTFQPSRIFEIFPHVDEGGLPPPKDHDGRLLDSESITDVQGSFRNFALFTKAGDVLIGTQDQIREWHIDSNARTRSDFTRVPALQDKGVIKIAFGDHHFLALHKDGYITSYGTESEACGSLGLGGNRDPEGRLRGIRYTGLGGDGKLVPHAYSSGRRVWFEPEKRAWITFLASGGVDPQEAVERIRMTSQPDVQAEVSEWIEEEGNAWDEKYGHVPQEKLASGAESIASYETAQEGREDSLAPYFALSVTAAGWHSGALVCVDEKAAKRIRGNCIIPEALPVTDPPAQSPTQQPEGMLTNIGHSIMWFFGLTTASEPQPSSPQRWERNDHQPGPMPDYVPRAFVDHGTPPPPQPGQSPVPNPTGRPRPTSGRQDDLGFVPLPGPSRPGHFGRRGGRFGRLGPQPMRPLDPPAAAPAPEPDPDPGPDAGSVNTTTSTGERPHRAFTDPINHGAAPDEHNRWIWAYDPFPRLLLSDGREMPGRVPLSEWRRGVRPSWDLEFRGQDGWIH